MLYTITIGIVPVLLPVLALKLPFGSVKIESIFGANGWSVTECSAVFKSIWKCSFARVVGD